MPQPLSLRSLRRFVVAVVGVAVLGTALTGCFGIHRGAAKPVASATDLHGVNTGIKLDPGFTKALSTLGLTPGVTGDAVLRQGGVLVFPITGGNVTVFKPGEVLPYVLGQIQHHGSGLTLTGSGTTVRLSNFTIDPGSSKVYGDVAVNGKKVASTAYVFKLDGRTLKKFRTNGRRAILTGTKVEVSSDAADLLNQTFNTKAVKAGLLVGVATITLKTT